MSDTNRPTVAILLTPEMRAQLIPPDAEARLAEQASVVAPAAGVLEPCVVTAKRRCASRIASGWVKHSRS